MGNRKALFALACVLMLPSFCLVPAFAADYTSTGEDQGASVNTEQPAASDAASADTSKSGGSSDPAPSSTTAPDAVTDAQTSGSAVSNPTAAAAPASSKSIYDLALEHEADLADGLYSIGSSVNGAFVLDVPGGNATAGKKLQVYGANNTNAQVWRVTHDKHGFVVISSVKGCTLDVTGGKAKGNNAIQLWSDNGTLAQRWIAIKNSDGSYTLVSALDPSYVIDMAGGKASKGSAIQLYKGNDTAAQRWMLTPAKTEQQQLDDRAVAHRDDLADGTYAILASNDSFALKVNKGSLALAKFGYSGIQTFDVSTRDDGYRTIAVHGVNAVLDAAGGKDTNGTKVQAYSANGTKAQKWIIERDGSRFRIVSALNARKVIDISCGSVSAGKGLQLYDANGATTQLFCLVDLQAVRAGLNKLASDNVGAIQDGEYAIVAGPTASRMVLDVASGSTSSGANVQIYPSNATGAQRWRISHDGNGYLTITNVKSGKVLDVSGGSTSPRTNVQVYSANGNANYAQKWIAVSNGDGSVRLISAVWQNRALDIAGGSMKAKTNVQLYVANGTAAQSFTFIYASPEAVSPCEDILHDTGWCVISPSNNNSVALDVAGGSLQDGGNIQSHVCNGTLSQLFKAEYRNGYYVLRNAGSGKVLDVAAGDVVPGTNVRQWEENGSDDQLFSAVACENGSYSFINKATGLTLTISGSNVVATKPGDAVRTSFTLTEQKDLLTEGLYEIYPSANSSLVFDVASGSTNSGANVQLYARNNSFAQKWLLKKVPGEQNTYTFESVCSTNRLAVSGANVCVSSPSNSKSQQWVAKIDKNGIEFVSALDQCQSIGVSSGQYASKSNIVTGASNGSKAQRFRLRVTSDTIANGTYFIQMASRAIVVLNVAGGSSASGANVQVWQNNNSGAQKWNLSRNGDGSYAIINAASGRALDVSKAAAASGTNIQQWNKNGSAAQRWFISYESGGFRIYSALDRTFVIDVSGGSAANGANVCLWASGDSSSQHFTFKATSYTPPIPPAQQAMLNRAQRYSSRTGWLILTDTVSCRTGIFKGSRGHWKLQSFWQCAPGKNSTPTVVGEFTVTGKGLSFGRGHTCWYYTQFYGDYLFHSQPCYSGTFKVKDHTMGRRVSAGCIRLTTEHSKWIYDNIPYGTKVVNY